MQRSQAGTAPFLELPLEFLPGVDLATALQHVLISRPPPQLRIPWEIHCCHCHLVVLRGTNSQQVLWNVQEDEKVTSLAFRIPLNGCGSGTRMRLESPGETFGSRTGDLSPQQAPQFDPVRHALDIATEIVEAPWRRLSFTGKITAITESGDQRFQIIQPFCHSLHLSAQMVDLAIKLGHSILECFLSNSRRRQRSTAIVKLGHGATRRELAEIERGFTQNSALIPTVTRTGRESARVVRPRVTPTVV